MKRDTPNDRHAPISLTEFLPTQLDNINKLDNPTSDECMQDLCKLMYGIPIKEYYTCVLETDVEHCLYSRIKDYY